VSPPEGIAIPEAAAQQGQPPAEDWQDRYLRLAAEFDNYRKRSARDFGELVRSAERDLVAELTEVLDNFGRALDTDHKSESVAEFTRGMALIREQFWTALSKRGLERMETVGCPFDPNEHDAMVRMPSDKFAEGIVMQEVSPGYRLGNKVLRYARVVVSQGKPDTSVAPAGREETPA
jgi:molecular chaperone GrpE